MSEAVDALIRKGLIEICSSGVGSHMHLDDMLGAAGPPPGSESWIDVARRVVEIALEIEARFAVSVPLGSISELPHAGREICGAAITISLEAPSVYHLSSADDIRTWAGEYYRLDSSDSTSEIRIFTSASRTLGERAAGEPFDLRLHFETRPQ